MTNRKFFAFVVSMLLIFMLVFSVGCGGGSDEKKGEGETISEESGDIAKPESKAVIVIDEEININALSVNETGKGWSFKDGILTLNSSNLAYRIYGTGEATTNRILVKAGVDAVVVLNNVSIDVSSIDEACAFDITSADVKLYLQGENFLKSGSGRAGLEVPYGAMVTVRDFEDKDIGSLTAIGGSYGGAGIGGHGMISSTSEDLSSMTSEDALLEFFLALYSNGRAGTIIIESGTITAKTYDTLSGAGIGGGCTAGPSGGGLIIIRGGNITAQSTTKFTTYSTGTTCSAGIGSGFYASGEDGYIGDDGTKIFIAGGKITALAQGDGAGIGGGGHSNSGVIRILDGLQSSINATGGPGAQNIGYGAGGNISDVEYIDAVTLERLIEAALVNVRGTH